jgi:1-acyl-sn-glycerol-3-phosphate acyltransferase
VLGRSPWPTRFLAAVSWIFGARVRLTGAPLRPHSLLVANHLSWFDIVVLGGATGCAFVAKDELGHPFIHWLADQNHTVYVKRTHRKGAKDQAAATAEALEREQPVALFAEGTTGPGTHLLPFRSALLEAANYASKEVVIRPVAIEYGEAATEVSWFEEAAMDNVWRLLGRRGTLPVTVHLLPPLDRSGDRKQLALEAREAIARTLGFKLADQSPIGSGE